MSSLTDSEKGESIINCPECTRLLENPRSLPCIHTFCLKCLEKKFGKLKPKDKTKCPQCAQEFRIPDRGLTELARNVFLESLVEARKTSTEIATVNAKCECCEKRSKLWKPAATTYCVSCNQKLCNGCSEQHRTLAGAGQGHVMKPIRGRNMDSEIHQARVDFCPKHEDRQIEFYCKKCKVNICYVCLGVDHDQHEREEIKTTAEAFGKKIDDDSFEIFQLATDIDGRLNVLEKEKTSFMKELDEIRKGIKEKAEEVKLFVDIQASELLQELQQYQTETCAEVMRARKQLELMLCSLKAFQDYCFELRVHGKPNEVTRSVNDLVFPAAERLKSVTPSEYGFPTVTFQPTQINKYSYENDHNIVGRLKLKKLPAAPVGRTVTSGNPVYGVTSLDDELYILRRKTDNQIEVYDTTTYNVLRSLTVPGLGSKSVDMVSSEHDQCLYISEQTQTCIHKMEPKKCLQPGDNCSSKWSTEGKPYGLSVTALNNLLVTCVDPGKLLEFTTSGHLVRKIDLRASGLIDPTHAVQMSNGHMVVSHSQRLTIIDKNGRAMKPHKVISSEVLKIDIDEDNYVYVADFTERRVLLFSPNLNFLRVVVPHERLAWHPVRMYLDAGKNRLYVADTQWIDGKYGDGRVVMFNLSDNIEMEQT